MSAPGGNPPSAPPGPPFGPRLAAGLLGILLAAMVAGLNSRIPGLAIADLRGALGYGVDEASWLSTAYAAGELAAMPFATWFAITFSLRRFHAWTLAGALALSALMPFVHALAPLLVLRALHGLLSGALIPLLMMAALRFLPPPIRLHGLALYALTATFAPNVAPWIASWALDTLQDWRWLYWSVVAPGLLALGLVLWGVPKMPLALPRLRQANWLGMAVGLPGLALLVVGLDQGTRLDWLNSPLIGSALVAGGGLTALYLWTEWRHPAPFIKLQMLGRRNLGLGFTAFFLMLICMSSGVALPLADLATQHGLRLEQTAAIGLFVGLPQLLLGSVVALLLYQRRVDARHLFAIGLGCMAAACWLAAGLDGRWMLNEFWPAQLLQTVGQPLAVVSMLFLGTSVVQPMEGPYVSGIVNTLRALGTVCGAALVGRLMTLRGGHHAEMLIEHGGPRLALGADAPDAGTYAGWLAHEAAVLATADVYRVFALVLVALVPLVLLLQHVPAPQVPRTAS